MESRAWSSDVCSSDLIAAYIKAGKQIRVKLQISNNDNQQLAGAELISSSTNAKATTNAHGAVSYTHLDVYKRQIIAPLFCYLFFTTLMWNGLPTDMPAGVVDLDHTANTRSICLLYTYRCV